MNTKTIICTVSAIFLLFNSLFSQNNSSDTETDIKKYPVYYNLKKALRNKEKAYRLNLSKTELTEFPVDIFELTELRYLILDSNQIIYIPEKIYLLEKLEILSITNNKIESLPSSIGNLHYLYCLYVDFNKLSDLPSELFFLNLVELYINNNNIKTFSSDFIYMKELRTLIASNNKFEEIPNEIGHLYNLKKLSLSNNFIKELPSKFFELSNLEFLYLYGNQLTQIDDNIENLKKLEFLNISKNKIKILPSKIGNLHQLKKLYVADNELESLPAEIGNLINLSILNLNNNPIKSLPEEIDGLKKLEHLFIKEIIFNPFPQVLYDLQNKEVKIYGLATKELYEAKLLLSKARNKKLIEDYGEAIEKYNKLLQLDTNNIQAMLELASAYLENGDFDLAQGVCEKVMSKDPENELTQEIKVIYDNSISKTNKTTRLEKEYETKVDEDTSGAPPSFNLGKHYFDKKKYNKAFSYFQKAIDKDPSHANSHLYLAIVSLIQQQKTTFIYSSLRYLILEPNGKKAETIMPFLFNKMRMKTGVVGEKGSTSYYDSYIIRDDNNEIIYKSDHPTADLLGAMMLDLTKSNIIMDDTLKNDTVIKGLVQTVLHTNKNNVEIFQYELNRICMSDTNEIEQNESFFNNYYLPYYTDLINNGHLETFAYIINNIRQKWINNIKQSEENSFAIWLKDNSDKADKFNIWSENYKWDIEQALPNE